MVSWPRATYKFFRCGATWSVISPMCVNLLHLPSGYCPPRPRWLMMNQQAQALKNLILMAPRRPISKTKFLNPLNWCRPFFSHDVRPHMPTSLVTVDIDRPQPKSKKAKKSRGHLIRFFAIFIHLATWNDKCWYCILSDASGAPWKKLVAKLHHSNNYRFACKILNHTHQKISVIPIS